MATVHRGSYIAASAGAAVSAVPGDLIAIVATTATATFQTVTFYNAAAATPGTEIAVLNLYAYTGPLHLRFPRDEAIPFDTALYVVNSNVNLLLWYVER